MSKITPIAVGEASAARMLDMTKREFVDLVQAGALPGPVTIATGMQRWNVSQLQSVLNGDAMDEDEFST